MRSIMIVLALCLIGASAIGSGTTESSGTSAAGNPSSGALDEIVVTAQKRSEKMQDVPINISVQSLDDLDKKKITDIADLQFVVPGLTTSESAGSGAAPRIRGVGSAIANAGGENAVATYVDGVYYADSTASLFNFNNISQIAVLKGPQGTLFGRNATGGVIQLTTLDPSSDFGGKAVVNYGNLDTYGGDLYVTGGVSGGLTADLSVHFNDQRNGFGRNLFNGEYVNLSRELDLRSKWVLNLGEDTTARLIADYTEKKESGELGRPMYGILAIGGYRYTGGPFDVDLNTQPLSNTSAAGLSLNVDHHFAGVDVVNIAAFRETHWHLLLDSDTTPLPLFAIDSLIPSHQFSDELQFISTGKGPLTWEAGFYYFSLVGGYRPVSINGAPILDFIQTIHSVLTTKSYSGYVQGTYKLTDQTALTLGARVTNDKKDIDATSGTFVPSINLTIPSPPASGTQSATRPTYRVSLDHHFDESVLGYISYNRGFKSGGFNGTQLTPLNSYSPETLNAFEVGVKSDLLDNRLRINASAFYYDYKNSQQTTVLNGTPYVYNAPKATIYGLDLDVTGKINSNLVLTESVSLLRDRLGDFPITPIVAQPGGGFGPGSVENASGLQLPNTPEFTSSTSVTYLVPLSRGSLQATVNYYYSGRWYAVPYDTFYQGSYSLVNASAKWSIDSAEKYYIAAWGKNLGNTAYAAQMYDGATTQAIAVAPGRTYGITFGAKF